MVATASGYFCEDELTLEGMWTAINSVAITRYTHTISIYNAGQPTFKWLSFSGS